mgnify:CR=1 FL=1
MDFFDKYKFASDNPDEFGIDIKAFQKPKILDESHLSNLLSHSIRITNDILPKVTKSINTVFKRLKIETNEKGKKINSICKFDFVDQVKSKNIDQNNKEKILELIGIDYLKNKDDYEVNLMFNNNAHISLKMEAIEVRLEDQNEIK